MTYKLGKLPARKGAVKLELKNYLDTAVLPKPPSKFGHQTMLKDWGMLGNDEYGDCVFAGAGHETMLWNKEANKLVVVTTTNALSDYTDLTGFNPNDPNTDQGTDMQAAASYRLKKGIIDDNGDRHKIGAYLALPTGNTNLLKQAIYLFSAVGIGIEFPESAMTQFNDNKNWSIVSKSPIEGGHYVPAVGYDSRYIYVVTWGKCIKMTYGFFKKYCDEAIVYLSPEMLINGKSLEGFNLAQLQADLQAVTKG